MNTANLVAFEEQKLLAVFGAEGLDETQKNEQFKASFKRLTNLSVLTLVNSIDSIAMEDGVVVRNPEDIKEYLENCERQTYEALKTQIDRYSSENKLQPLRIKCDNCEHEYTSDITFDQSNFFG
jgi:aspartate carbamoyltransferase regulatory subunit